MHCIWWSNCSQLILISSRRNLVSLLSLFWYSDTSRNQSCQLNKKARAINYFDVHLTIAKMEFFPWNGPRSSLQRNQWLKRVLLRLCILLLHFIQTTCKIPWCCWSTTGAYWQNSDYCTVESEPNSCLLGYLTRLVSCLYVKLFLPAFFNLVKSWSSISSIALHLERKGKISIRDFRVSFHENAQEYWLCPPKKTIPQNKRIVVREFCTELFRTVDNWITMSSETFILRM